MRKSVYVSVFVFVCAAIAMPATAQTPTVTSVVNQASRQSSFSPGGLVSIFGTNLLPDMGGNPTVTLGGENCGVISAIAGELIVELPVDAALGAANLVVFHDALSSTPVVITLNAFSPAIITVNGSGTGAGSFYDGNNVVTVGTPAKIGDVIIAYGVGLGATSPAVGTGITTPGPIPNTVASPTVTVNGTAANVGMSGLTPGLIGTYQTNFIIPPGVNTGVRNVTWAVGGVTSPPVTIQIGGVAAVTTLATSAKYIPFGQSVTFTATLSPSTATGNVTFYDGVTALEVETVANGQAQLPTIALATGIHSIKAYYGGDSKNAASASAALKETVIPVAAGRFAVPVNYGAGNGPASVAVGDFTAGGATLGLADLAVANFFDNTISILTGNGDGTFQPAVNYATGPGTGPNAVIVGDFDGDGVLDLATANYSGGGISVLQGISDGTFMAAVIYPTDVSPNAVAAGDFNGDGNYDLVAVGASGNVSVLLGIGDGTFQTFVSYPLGAGLQLTGVAVADFNGDGIADLAVTESLYGSVYILLGNGDGTFRTPRPYGVGNSPYGIVVSDFNGDGKADLAVAQSTNGVAVLLGNGDGTFQSPVVYGEFLDTFGLAVSDFDADGIPDIVTTGGGLVYVMLGVGDGSFQTAVQYSSGIGSASLAIADFNGDAIPDFVTANLGGVNVSVFLGTGPSQSQTILFGALSGVGFGAAPITISATASSGLTVTFFTAATNVCSVSGTTVTIVAGGVCSITAEQLGNATFGAATRVTQSFTVSPVTQTIAFGALNNQALGSVPPPLSAAASSGLAVTFSSNSPLVCTVSGATVTLLKVGLCSITAHQAGNADYAAATSATPQTFTVAVGTAQTITFRALPNRIFGSSPFVIAAQDSSGLPAGFATTTPAVCTNADDLIVLLGAGTCSITISQAGNATYNAAPPATQSFTVGLAKLSGSFTTSSPLAAGSNPASVVVGDFNGDGIPDVATANPGNSSVTVMLGNVSGGFTAAPGSPFAAGSGPGSMAVGDFNGDGNQDLAVANTDFSTLTVLLGDGSGKLTATPGSPYPAGVGPSSIVVGDFNGDGIQDLAAANFYSGNVTVLLGSGLGAFTPATGSPFSLGVTAFPGPEPQALVVGDFNGDGIQDLATANSGTNNVTVLQGNGAGGFTPFPLSPFYAGGANPYSLVVVNLNGAVQDLAVTSTLTNSVTVLVGDGMGGFPNAEGPFAVGSSPVSVVAGDFNGDGIQDLAVANSSSNNVTVLLGSASGGFAEAKGSPWAVPSGPFSVAVGDFNGDGIEDLVTANDFDGSITVLMGAKVGNTSQTITFGVLYDVTFGVAPFAIGATASSGLAVSFASATPSICTVSSGEVSIVGGSSTCAILASQPGNVTYAAAATVMQTFMVNPESQIITFNPLSNQALGSVPPPLIATASSGLQIQYNSNSLTICTVSGFAVTLLKAGLCSITANQPGDFAGRFAPAESIIRTFTVSALGTAQTITFAAIPNQILGISPFVIAAEANSSLPVGFASTGYGVCRTAGSLVILFGAGSCSVTASQPGNAAYRAATSVTKSFTVSLAKTSGSFAAAAGSPFAVGNAPQSVAVGDVNGDGIPDLVTANFNTNDVTVLLGNKSGGFAAAPDSPFAAGSGPNSVVVADINGDGIQDIAVADLTGHYVTVLTGDGKGGFKPAAGSPFAMGTYPNSIVVGDFNGDGLQDFATATLATNNVAVLLENASGGFTTTQTNPFATGSFPISPAVGDFNSDGVQDLAVADNGTNKVTVLLGNGSGGFTASVGSPFAVGSGPQSVAVGDFNGDGSLDLAIANTGDNTVTVLLGDGSGGFTPGTGSPFTVGTKPYSVVVGDFNGDGFQDIAVANNGTGNVTVLRGNGLGGFAAAPGSPFAVGSGPRSVTVGDFNGDGIEDLAVANANDNTVTVLFGLVVGSTAQTITFVPPSTVTWGVLPFTIGASSTSGLTVGFASSAAAVCTVAGNTVTILSAGLCSIVASQAGNATYAPASVTQSFTVNPESQTITFGVLSDQTLGSPPVSLDATVSSGQGAFFGSNSLPVCTVSGTSVTLVAVGTCSITASQPGLQAHYLAALPVTQTFTISALGIQPVAGFLDQQGAPVLTFNNSTNFPDAGGFLIGPPGVTQDLKGNTYVVGLDSAGGVHLNSYNFANSTWNGWQYSGGILDTTSGLTAAVDSSGVVWFTGRDIGNRYWINSWNGTGFGGWILIADGIFSSDSIPQIAIPSDGTIYVVGKDIGGRIWSNSYNPTNQTFTGWVDRQAIMIGQPSITAGQDGFVYVAVRSVSSNSPVYITQIPAVNGANAGCTGCWWLNGGGLIDTDPLITSQGGTVYLMALAGNNTVYLLTFEEATQTYGRWSFTNGTLNDATIAAAGGNVFIAGRDTADRVYWYSLTANTWFFAGGAGVSSTVLAGGK